MENTYYLIAEQQAGGQCLRTIDEYPSADRLIADAADYEAVRDRRPVRQATTRARS